MIHRDPDQFDDAGRKLPAADPCAQIQGVTEPFPHFVASSGERRASKKYAPSKTGNLWSKSRP